MKAKKFVGKMSNCKNFPESPNFFLKIGGKSETGGGNASWSQRDGRPWFIATFNLHVALLIVGLNVLINCKLRYVSLIITK